MIIQNMKFDIVVVSHASLDLYLDKLYLGGPVSYCGRLLDELGANYLVVGMVGKEFPFKDYYKKRIKSNILVESTATTSFVMEHIKGIRHIKISAKAEPFDIAKIPKEAIKARYILLSPIIDDMPIEFIKRLSKRTNAKLCIDPFNNDNGKFSKVQKVYFLEVANYVEIIKLSQNELVGLSGFKDLNEAITNYLSKFNNIFIITLGKNGARIYKKNEINKTVRGIDLCPFVDATGCGDIFFAGFIYGLSKEYQLEECVLFGNICAGLSVSSKGVDSIPKKEDIIKMYNSLK